MKAIASLFVDAFIPLREGSSCNADNNFSFSVSRPAITHSGKRERLSGPVDHSSQNSSAVIIPSKGHASTSFQEANLRATAGALSSHCSKSVESYTITSFH